MEIPEGLLRERILQFLKEDIGMSDLTTEAIVPKGRKARAQIMVKEPAVIAGIREATVLFEMLGIKVVNSVDDGSEVLPGTSIAEIEGDSRDILAVERTALNILMRMSGIATVTRRLVKEIRKRGFKTRIAATRKTAPGLRYFDKKAVAIGGGDTHRLRLDDMILIKDNHIVIANGIENAVKKARSAVSFAKKIEVEVKTFEEALGASQLGVDIIMLDNMSPEEVKRTLNALREKNLRDRILIEISGNITEENILEYAELEPDVISLGFLTHSVKAVDMSLEILNVHR